MQHYVWIVILCKYVISWHFMSIEYSWSCNSCVYSIMQVNVCFLSVCHVASAKRALSTNYTYLTITNSNVFSQVQTKYIQSVSYLQTKEIMFCLPYSETTENSIYLIHFYETVVGKRDRQHYCSASSVAVHLTNKDKTQKIKCRI